MKVLRYLVPLAVFVVLMGFLWRGLHLDPRTVPSPLIDKAAPAFNLPLMGKPGQLVHSDSMRGQVWLLNVWGSWCVSCREEHATLLEFSRSSKVPLVGLDWKDDPAAADEWLRKLGNPYAFTVVDAEGRVAIDYGVYGAPETFVIDKTGIIRHKVIGVLTPDILRNEVMPLLQKLQS